MSLRSRNSKQLLSLVYYASGCSIAKFPEDGIVITQTFKDQGKECYFGFFPFFISISFAYNSHLFEKKIGGGDSLTLLRCTVL